MSDSPHLLTYFYDHLREQSEMPLLAEKRGSLYHWLSWKESAQAIADASRAFTQLGLQRGQRVAMIATLPSVELMIAECAALAMGALVVPIPAHPDADDQAQAIQKSQSTILLTNSLALLNRLQPHASGFAHAVLASSDPLPPNFPCPLHRWSELKAKGKAQPDRISTLMRSITDKDNIALIYAKRDMPALIPRLFSHHLTRAIITQVVHQVGETFCSRGKVIATLLPYTHPLARPVCLYLPVFYGVQQYFLEDSGQEAAELAAIAPETILAESIFFTRLKERLIADAKQEGEISYKAMMGTLAAGKKRYESPKLGFWGRFKQWMQGEATITRIRRKLGNKVKLIVAVDGKLPYDTILFFHTFGINHLDLDDDSIGLGEDALTALKRIDRGQAAPGILG